MNSSCAASAPQARSLAVSRFTPDTILSEKGFSNEDAARAWRALWSYTFGFATFAVVASPAEVRRRTRSTLAGLPEEQYPALTGAADEFAEVFASDDEFELGLAPLLDGLEASLPAS